MICKERLKLNKVAIVSKFGSKISENAAKKVAEKLLLKKIIVYTIAPVEVDGAKQVWIYPFPKDSSKGLDAVLYEKDKLIGRVVAQSKKTDLALVKVTGLSSGIKVITLGDV